MTEVNRFSFISSGSDININAAEWIPDTEPIGIVQISHGVAEHIKRYDDFANYLAKEGFVVAANDHIGHGQSYRNKEDYLYLGERNGWFHAVEDMKTLHDIMHEKYPKLPYFILGHSMGSFLTRTYLIKYHEALSGAILSGTGYTPGAVLSAGRAIASGACALKGTRSRSKLLNGMAFGSYNKAFSPNRTESDWLSCDEAQVDLYIADPKCGGIPTSGLFKEMFRGLAFNQNGANVALMNKDTPVLFISGAMDPVGSFGKGVKTSYEMFLKYGMKDVSLKLYPKGRHELLNEVNNSEVYAYICGWLTSKIERL